MELTRADIGFGRVVIDDHGVTRRNVFSTRRIAWDAILDYRISIDLRDASFQPMLGELGPLAAAVFRPMLDPSAFDFLGDVGGVINGYRGRHAVLYGIDLFGPTGHVAFDWRFKHAAAAITEILRQIYPRLDRYARSTFELTGAGVFGKLTLTDDGIRWADRPLLPRAEVEAIELFDSSPVRLRVMARRKVLAYARAQLPEIPNLASMLRLARALGYRLRGTELLSQLQ